LDEESGLVWSAAGSLVVVNGLAVMMEKTPE